MLLLFWNVRKSISSSGATRCDVRTGSLTKDLAWTTLWISLLARAILALAVASLRLPRRVSRVLSGYVLRVHFNPWLSTQGQSGFAWAWLGAALQATQLPFGVVNAPGTAISSSSHRTGCGDHWPRCFPTLLDGIGSGQLLNEILPVRAGRTNRHARLDFWSA